jgi:hypothetical protein
MFFGGPGAPTHVKSCPCLSTIGTTVNAISSITRAYISYVRYMEGIMSYSRLYNLGIIEFLGFVHRRRVF